MAAMLVASTAPAAAQNASVDGNGMTTGAGLTNPANGGVAGTGLGKLDQEATKSAGVTSGTGASVGEPKMKTGSKRKKAIPVQ